MGFQHLRGRGKVRNSRSFSATLIGLRPTSLGYSRVCVKKKKKKRLGKELVVREVGYRV